MLKNQSQQGVVFTLVTEAPIDEASIKHLFNAFDHINKVFSAKVTYTAWVAHDHHPNTTKLFKNVRTLKEVELPLKGGSLNIRSNVEMYKSVSMFSLSLHDPKSVLNHIQFAFPGEDSVGNLSEISRILEPVLVLAVNKIPLVNGYVGFSSQGASSSLALSDYELDMAPETYYWGFHDNFNKYLRGVYWLNYIKKDLWDKVEKNLEGEDYEVKQAGNGYILKLSKDLDSFTDEKLTRFEKLLADILPGE